MVKSLKIAMGLLNIEPFDTGRLTLVSELSSTLLTPFAIAVRKSAQQHKIYELIMGEHIHGDQMIRESIPLSSLIANPSLKRSTVYLMIRDGLWKDYPMLLRQPHFDVNLFVRTDPRIRGKICPALANKIMEQNHGVDESTVFEFWSVGVQHNDLLLKINCTTHPKASVDMIDAYLSGSTVQEIELRRQGVDEDHLESIKDFFWY
jgi:hypothetical protein